MSHQFLCRVCVAFAVSFAVPLAPAQSWTAAGSSPFLWSNQSPLGVYRSVNTMMLSRLPSAGTPQAHAAANPVQNAPLSATNFARSNVPVMPERMAGPHDKDRAQRLQIYGAMLDAYDQLLKDSGESGRLRSNVAGALTFLLASSHYVRNNGSELSDAQQELILKDINNALAQTPAFQAMAARQKQELFETAAITGAYALTLYRVGNSERNKEYVGAARELADMAVEQIMGTPLTRLSLDNGLRLR